MSLDVKQNTLWYNDKTDTHHFVFSVLPDKYTLSIWLGNGDMKRVLIDDLGVLIEQYDSYDDAEPKILELLNK